MNGINFTMDGPIMDGTWYNTTTGDSFTVRDTFFQDNQLMVSTTDGRLMDYNMIQNYIKSDKPINIPKQQKQTQSQELPQEVASILESPAPQDPYMLDEDAALISGRPTHTRMSNNYVNVSTSNPIANKIEQGIGLSEDQRLVERVLSRQQQPSISCNIKWTKFPQKQMDVLMDMMGVDIEDVCNYYISKINLEDIRESIKRDIKNYIEAAMGYNGIDEQYVPDVNNSFYEVVVVPCEAGEYSTTIEDNVENLEKEVVTEKPKKTTPKKTTKKK